MWNRQRVAAEAREKLAQVEEAAVAPNRNPPPVEDPVVEDVQLPIPAATAAE
jgi:ATP-binding cassette subfamily B protein